MAEVRQLHQVERDIEKILRSFPGSGAKGGGRRPSVEAQAAGSHLELLTENDRDENPRVDTNSHLNWADAPTVVNFSSPSIRSSKQALETSNVIFAIGRTAIVITFIVSALFRLMNVDVIASKLLPLTGPLADAAASIEATLGVPFATALVIAGAALEIMAAVLIAVGVLIRPASIVLLIFTAIGIYGSQWDFHNGVRLDQIIEALNDLSIMGALLILYSGSLGLRTRLLGAIRPFAMPPP
jgi:uncharacterized membrane protein YphA (DoxX/SURF4 family)